LQARSAAARLQTVLIGAFGEFWDARLVDWFPGPGKAWSLLGKRGQYLPGLRVVDFRRARGVYVLYDDHGAYYAGLARGTGGIGGRLKDHMSDSDAGHWSRFSWYSFDGVARRYNRETGLHDILRRDKPVPASDEAVIRELEALLITVLGTRGQNRMRFQAAELWQQVSESDKPGVLKKIHDR
jgi:hypothetical protein